MCHKNIWIHRLLPTKKINNNITSVVLYYLKTLLEIFYVSYNILRTQIYDNLTKQTLVLYFTLIWFTGFDIFVSYKFDLKVFGRIKNWSMHTNYLIMGYYLVTSAHLLFYCFKNWYYCRVFWKICVKHKFMYEKFLICIWTEKRNVPN